MPIGDVTGNIYRGLLGLLVDAHDVHRVEHRLPVPDQQGLPFVPYSA